MKNIEINSKTDLQVIPKAENQKGIDNHKKAATHFEAAAKSHHEAAKCTVEAHGHSCVANEAQKEDVKHHTTKNLI
ncbi:MAG: hypothetical protein IPJ81_12995 [Chitinophagaceae bacterium]|nr:hypothetical protein [Chitinophagaceae bacterium]